MYEELVQEYSGAMQEYLSMPEKPGPIYESSFFPGEKVDTDILLLRVGTSRRITNCERDGRPHKNFILA